MRGLGVTPKLTAKKQQPDISPGSSSTNLIRKRLKNDMQKSEEGFPGGEGINF